MYFSSSDFTSIMKESKLSLNSFIWIKSF